MRQRPGGRSGRGCRAWAPGGVCSLPLAGHSGLDLTDHSDLDLLTGLLACLVGLQGKRHPPLLTAAQGKVFLGRKPEHAAKRASLARLPNGLESGENQFSPA